MSFPSSKQEKQVHEKRRRERQLTSIRGRSRILDSNIQEAYQKGEWGQLKERRAGAHLVT